MIVYSTFNVATLSIYIYNNNNNKTQLHGTRAYRVSFSFTPSFRFLFRTSHNIGNCGGKSRKNKNFCIYYIRRSPLLGSSQKTGGGGGLMDSMNVCRSDSNGRMSTMRERERERRKNREMSWSVCFCCWLLGYVISKSLYSVRVCVTGLKKATHSRQTNTNTNG